MVSDIACISVGTYLKFFKIYLIIKLDIVKIVKELNYHNYYANCLRDYSSVLIVPSGFVIY